ncbi:MAG TPA: hypothetical protein DCS67_11560 [Clostridiales bacterium UBA8960]|nr:hypothetical protein [Clostridiales bacterium UBA8960]
MNVLTYECNKVLEIVTVFDDSTKEIKDLRINNALKPRILGNVYAAKVISIMDGMEGAFVDIGEPENAFIQRTQLLRAVGLSPSKNSATPLSKLVKKGQMFLGQVDKEPYQSKGAQLTNDISIAGKYIVLKPFLKGVKISRKTGFKAETELMETALTNALTNRYGVIVRSATFSDVISPDAVLNELETLISIWESLKKRFELMSTVKCIYQNSSTGDDLVSMAQAYNVDKIFVVSPKDKTWLISLGIDKNKITVKRVDTSLYQEVGLDLDRFLRAVKFNSKEGISVTINELEAFTVIDVNSSKYVMDLSKRDRVFEVNDLAAIIILEKILLFNISGIILIDFIDMSTQEQLAFVQHLLDKGFNKKNGITIEGFTALGILEITRKRVSPSLKDLLSFNFEDKDLKFWDLHTLFVDLARMKHHTNTTQVNLEVETSLFVYLRQNNLFDGIDLKVNLKHNESTQKNYKLHTSKH